jgi:hypothetical protein
MPVKPVQPVEKKTLVKYKPSQAFSMLEHRNGPSKQSNEHGKGQSKTIICSEKPAKTVQSAEEKNGTVHVCVRWGWGGKLLSKCYGPVEHFVDIPWLT